MALSWLFADERDEDARSAARTVAMRGALVPALFRWEIQNALAVAARRGRISLSHVPTLLGRLDRVGLQTDAEVLTLPLSAGFQLVERFALSAYDAAYLELAERRRLPLMTRDRKLTEAAATINLLWKP
jgi:predicted nucleic acid-binding protein